MVARTEGPQVLKGLPASPGRVRGTARVIASTMELHLLQPGEVLVVPITSADHDETLGRAAGLVTDVGAGGSHSASEARARHIPAVLGTGIATRCISDGMVIEVDGDTGQVTLPEGAAPIPTGFRPRVPYKFAIGAGAAAALALVRTLTH